MRVGKSGVVRCDFCGEVVIGRANSFDNGGQVKHFCANTCMDEYFLDRYNDRILEEVEKRTRGEYKVIHGLVCPGCKWRMVNKLDPPDDPTKCLKCETQLVCPACGWES